MNEINLGSENKINKKMSYSPLNAREIFREKDYPEIMTLECQEQQLTASLSDGRLVSIPVFWFKKLREATNEQLNNFEILPDGYGITWPQLDEDISVKVFVEGIS